MAQGTLLDNEQNVGPIPLRDPRYLLPSIEPCLTALVLQERWSSETRRAWILRSQSWSAGTRAFPEDSFPLQRERQM